MTRLILIVLVVLISASGFTYFLEDKGTYEYLIQEDGIFENLSALTMLLMSILLVIKAVRDKKQDKNILYTVLLALACFFGFGEEISWGQRLFSVESGDFFNEFNAQKETNLHNIKINGVKLNKVIFSLGLSVFIVFYFVIAQPLYRMFEPFKKLVDRFNVQIPKTEHLILMAGSVLLIVIIPDGKKWELLETTFVLIFLMVLLNPFNVSEKLLKR